MGTCRPSYKILIHYRRFDLDKKDTDGKEFAILGLSKNDKIFESRVFTSTYSME